MLYVYKTDLNVYQLVKDVDGKEEVLLESNVQEECEAAFYNEIASRRKTTLLSFDGQKVIDEIAKKEIK